MIAVSWFLRLWAIMFFLRTVFIAFVSQNKKRCIKANSIAPYRLTEKITRPRRRPIKSMKKIVRMRPKLSSSIAKGRP